MSNLNEYLEEKRQAMRERHAQLEATGARPHMLKATVRAEGRSGIRRIRIRDFQIISDSGPDFAGYNLGPTSPELQLGVLGSCLTHIFLIPLEGKMTKNDRAIECGFHPRAREYRPMHRMTHS